MKTPILLAIITALTATALPSNARAESGAHFAASRELRLCWRHRHWHHRHHHHHHHFR
jgi:hypothetical protein